MLTYDATVLQDVKQLCTRVLADVDKVIQWLLTQNPCHRQTTDTILADVDKVNVLANISNKM